MGQGLAQGSPGKQITSRHGFRCGCSSKELTHTVMEAENTETGRRLAGTQGSQWRELQA